MELIKESNFDLHGIVGLNPVCISAASLHGDTLVLCYILTENDDLTSIHYATPRAELILYKANMKIAHRIELTGIKHLGFNLDLRTLDEPSSSAFVTIKYSVNAIKFIPIGSMQ